MTDPEVLRLTRHLSATLKVAGKRFDERALSVIAELGWRERGKPERDQSKVAWVCWAAELFAASESLLTLSRGEYQGVAAFLAVCAVDALDRNEPHGETTKKLLAAALQRVG